MAHHVLPACTSVLSPGPHSLRASLLTVTMLSAYMQGREEALKG